MATDPFEEFEFRPLTEGLGFHRQAEKKPVTAAQTSFELKSQLPEIEMPLSGRNSGNLAPEKTPESRPSSAKRAPLTEETPSSDSSATVDEILKTLHAKRKNEFALPKNATDAQGPAYRTSAPDLSAFVLDGMLVTASTLACLIILLMVTKVDLFNSLTQGSQDGDWALPLTLFALFAAVTWIYLVMNRIFMGFTPGEWVFDQRVGLPQNQGSADYSLRVTARATLVVLTGLILIPILSLVLGRDLAGRWTGAQLLKKV